MSKIQQLQEQQQPSQPQTEEEEEIVPPTRWEVELEVSPMPILPFYCDCLIISIIMYIVLDF